MKASEIKLLASIEIMPTQLYFVNIHYNSFKISFMIIDIMISTIILRLNIIQSTELDLCEIYVPVNGDHGNTKK